jgi:glycosyltransferase involved in cell wall biosynthesis
MKNQHFIETIAHTGGGVPRVAQTIKHFFPIDEVLPVNDIKIIKILFSIRNFSKIKANKKIVFVHNVYSLKAIFFGIISAIFSDAKLVVTPHGATNIKLVKNSFKKIIYLKFFSLIINPLVYKYHYLNIGEFNDSYIKKIAQIKHAIFSYPILLPEKIEYWVPKKNKEIFRIVFYSRVEKRKGIYNLLSAIRDLNSEGLKISLDIFGPMEDNLILLEIENMDCCRYRGLVKIDDYASEINDYDIFCLPSFGEAHSLALLENVFIGIPCLVSKETNSPPVEGIHVYGEFDDINAIKMGIKYFMSESVRSKASEANIQFGIGYNKDVIKRVEIF